MRKLGAALFLAAATAGAGEPEVKKYVEQNKKAAAQQVQQFFGDFKQPPVDYTSVADDWFGIYRIPQRRILINLRMLAPLPLREAYVTLVHEDVHAHDSQKRGHRLLTLGEMVIEDGIAQSVTQLITGGDPVWNCDGFETEIFSLEDYGNCDNLSKTAYRAG